MMFSKKRVLALVLALAVLCSLLPAGTVWAAEETAGQVLTQADYAEADLVFDLIEAAESAPATKDATQAQKTKAAMDVVKASDSYVEGSLEQSGNSFTWQTDSGIRCIYSPRMNKIRSEMNPENSIDEIVNEPQSVKGGTPSGKDVYLVGPFYGSDENFTNQYKKEARRVAAAMGDTDGYTLYSGTAATIDKVAEAVSNGAVVFFDSHGITDYENPSDEYDLVTGATSSYMWLSTADGLTTEDYDSEAAYYQDGEAIVNGQAIANHMTKNSPSGLLWMAICLGMATDGMYAPLRNKGVEVVYGYSESVTFDGDYLYEETFWDEMIQGKTVKDSIATMKSTWGNWDWSTQMAEYYGYSDGYATIEDARYDFMAFPVVVSDEDSWPGQRTSSSYGADSLQTVKSTYTLGEVQEVVFPAPETGYYNIELAEFPYYMGALSDNWILSSDTPTNWYLTVDGDSVKLQDPNGTYIAPKAGNNNGILSGEYSWELVDNGDDTYSFKGVGTDTTTLAANAGESYKFRAYKNATVAGEGAATQYPSTFILTPVDSSSVCHHESTTTNTVAATCTTAGATTVVCNACGNTISTTTIPATGHTDNDGNEVCDTCGADLSSSAVPTDPKEILEAAYALGANEDLPYTATLTGKITAVTTAYSSQYGNVTVIMTVEGCEDMPIKCYRLEGTGVDQIGVGDTITVSGTITNYQHSSGDTEVEFKAGCQLLSWVDGGSGSTDPDPEEPSDPVVPDGDVTGNYYIAVARNENYFYMTNSLGTASTSRYQAEDSYLSQAPAIIDAPEANKTFSVIDNGDGTYSICNDAGYLSWTSGNSGTFVESAADALKLTQTANDDGTVTFSFTGDAERYLSLNGTAGNNYFAWYKSGQLANLVLIPVGEGTACAHTNTTTTTVDATCTTAGSTTVTCDDCGKTISTTSIPATGHNYVSGTCSVCGATESTGGDVTGALADGQYILTCSNGIVLGVVDGTWILPGDTNTYWTLTVNGETATMQDSNGIYIAPKGGNNNGLASKEYSWSVVQNEDGTYSFKGQGEDTVILAYNTDTTTGLKFRAYKTSTVAGKPDAYPCTFGLTKYGADAHEHSYEYVDNGDGTHDYVCSGCGDISVDNAAHSYQEYVCVCGAVNKFNLPNTNPVLENALTMNFRVEKTRIGTMTGCYVVITQDTKGDVTKGATVYQSQWTTSGDYYVIPYNGIAAKEMGDDVTAVLYNANGVAISNPKTDSLKDYAFRGLEALKNATGRNAVLRTLLVDMLNYGAQAQTYFGYDAENLVNADLTDTQKAWATQSIDPDYTKTYTGTQPETSLILDNSILMKVAFFNVTEGMYIQVRGTGHSGTAIEVDYSYDEMTADPKVANKRFITIDKLMVADHGTGLTVTLYNADGSVNASVTDAVEGYVTRVHASNSTAASVVKLKALTMQLQKFCDAAYAYLHYGK